MGDLYNASGPPILGDVLTKVFVPIIGMKRFEFHLDISAQRYLSYYRGTVRQVVVQCVDGSTVQFPASFLTAFVAVNGIHGDFVLTCDDNFKGSELHRRSPV